MGDPVLLSVNVIFSGAFPEVGEAEKAATGVSKRLQSLIVNLSKSVFTLVRKNSLF